VTTSLSQRGVVRTLLTVCGVLFLVGAAVHNPTFISFAVKCARSAFHRSGILIPPARRIHEMQLYFLIAGAGFLAFAWTIGRVSALDSFFRKTGAEKLVLGLLVISAPVMWAELALRAFVPPREATTKLFLKDDDLGWKLRPGATDTWGGVVVHINEKGYRGPAIPYARTAGRKRVLFLGDSVTFGYRMARWQDTFPFLADSLAAASASLDVETVNLSVEGYSQWQEAIVMQKEGVQYQPDLVVLGFVLNDVTEMFHLVKFGGAEEGFQMRHAASSWLDKLLSKSAIAYEVQNVTREIKARHRLGSDVRLGAIKQQSLEVETLMRRPDQPNVKTAWDFALNDLKKIVDQCNELHIPFVIVAFPFAVQLHDPAGLGTPQRVLANYTQARNIEMLDMLPPLAAAARADSTAPLFVDEDHLSGRGHRLVAELLSPVIAGYLRRH
jgi:lysophospholipase L1-like esterase